MTHRRHTLDISRRTALKAIGAGTVLGSLTTGSAAAQEGGGPKKGNVRKMGQTILEESTAEEGPHFAEESIRSDGQYAVVGVFEGELGSFLVDISNPRDPTEVHRIESPNFATRHADVKFDSRDGLYYRTLEGEPIEGDDVEGDGLGVQVIDYGFDEGTPEEPEIIARLPAKSTHNVVAHPEEPVLYTANHPF